MLFVDFLIACGLLSLTAQGITIIIQGREIKKLKIKQDRTDALLVASPVNDDGRLLGAYSRQ